MRGKANSIPHNHVKWANGFTSNMPDWTTARQCVAAPALANILREVLVFFRCVETGEFFIYDESRRKAMMERLEEIHKWCGLGIDERSEWSVTDKPVIEYPKNTVQDPLGPQELTPITGKTIKSFPKPPGIK